MTLKIQINIESYSGELTKQEQAVLAALGTVNPERPEGDKPIARLEGIVPPPEAKLVPSPSDDQQKVLDEVTPPEPEKPKRKRRTKAEMEADRAAEQGGTGPAVLEDLGDPADGEKPVTEVHTEAELAEVKEDVEDVDPDEALLQAKENPTAADAFAKASAMVDAGRQTEVKAALEKMGVARASHITDEQAGEFLSLVS